MPRTLDNTREYDPSILTAPPPPEPEEPVASTSSPPPGHTIDIELGGQEVITVELDSLDPNPDDLLEVLKEGQCKVWIWTRLAAEYWRRGLLDAAEKIAKTAMQGAYIFLIYSGLSNSDTVV